MTQTVWHARGRRMDSAIENIERVIYLGRRDHEWRQQADDILLGHRRTHKQSGIRGVLDDCRCTGTERGAACFIRHDLKALQQSKPASVTHDVISPDQLL